MPFDPAMEQTAFVMGLVSLVLYKISSMIADPSGDKEKLSYMSRVMFTYFLAATLLAIAHHFGPVSEFPYRLSAFVLIFGWRLVSEYRRFTRRMTIRTIAN
jgi:hypothetical protein